MTYIKMVKRTKKIIIRAGNAWTIDKVIDYEPKKKLININMKVKKEINKKIR